MRDWSLKGLAKKARAKNKSNAKVTPEIVRAIRSSTETNVALARRYGLSECGTSYIKNRVTWKHLAQNEGAE